ncbi:MAG: orotidine-5'-phosphate decarboxylase [Gemmatimonadaceae bacterium]
MAGVTVAADRAAPVPIVALDFGTIDDAMALVGEVGELCRFYKVGSELFTAAGPAVISELRGRGCDVMLDLKFHDIPNTVAGAVASVRALGVRILTVHAAGGDAMIRAAAEAAGSECHVFAVTVLTSMDGPAVAAAWGREPVDVRREVVRLATLARDAGAAGVVASGHEVEAIRSALGSSFPVLVPGVRLPDADAADQRRVITPGRAREIGADYVVLGRIVTAAAGRRDAMERVLRELASPLD